ncbi:DNA methyltransferase [Nioella aestuarii]|uniref:DNA methyltransferase n=1 Tax=Nioella aestuarii TaxID=1662864 RepID=UPI003D800049
MAKHAHPPKPQTSNAKGLSKVPRQESADGSSLSRKAPSGSVTTRRNDPFPDCTLLSIAVDQIDEAPRRARRALKGQRQKVRRAVERFGFRVPILVKPATEPGRYEVVDGHVRLAVARDLGADAVPALSVGDLPDAEIRRLALSLNKLQESGEWDREVLKLELEELFSIDGDLEIPGFEMPELEALVFEESDITEPDAADADDLAELAAQPAVTQPGDRWILGDHRIFCGSALDGDELDRLLEGRMLDAVFTDPPYNVKVNGHVREAKGGFREFAQASGEMSREEFVAFLTQSLGNAAAGLKPGGVMFICMDWRHVGELQSALEALGLRCLNICVWVKDAPGMGSLYRSQHELVFVTRKDGASHQNNIQLGTYGRNRSNVWHYAGATGGRRDEDDDFNLHPTVKPLRMVRDALLDVTGQGDLVLDPFLGSGTTLLAAERCRRRCIGIELDPGYVDVAIRRWQSLTGETAVHAETGRRFAAMEGEAVGTPPPPPSHKIEEDF